MDSVEELKIRIKKLEEENKELRKLLNKEKRNQVEKQSYKNMR